MIDLSHLTEEEQGVIMTVLKRDAELKKAEEERIRKLEEILNSETQSDTNLKYMTGEWFYEAKSRRHQDKIHGSEIILASMKQGKAIGFDGSLRLDRSKTPSSRGSENVAPVKPARCWEGLQPPEINDAEKENRISTFRSPRTPRQNPFNHPSLNIFEPPEYNHDFSIIRDKESPEREPISPPKNQPAGETSQTSGGSVTSEGSSVGFRPVPKKRTFLSRRNQTESSGVGSDAQVGSAGTVPAPRQSLQRGSSGSSSQSCPKSQEEMSQKGAVSNQESQSAEENSLQLPNDIPQVSSNSNMERERKPPFITRQHSRSDVSTKRQMLHTREEQDDQTQRDHPALHLVAQNTSNTQDQQYNSSVGTTIRQEELSLPQSTVDQDPPTSYDLSFIDQQTQRSNQAHIFKLSTQATSPTGDEEDSINKVLDWFSRSMDSGDWLNIEDAPKSSNKHVEVSKSQGEDAGADRKTDKRSHLQRQSSEDKKLRATDRRSSKELMETQDEVDIRGRIHSQDVEDNVDESQTPNISHLKSLWEKSSTGPKILIGNKGRKPAQLLAEKQSNVSSTPGIYSEKEVHDDYTSNQSDEREHQLVISPQMDVVDDLYFHQQVNNLQSSERNNNDSEYSSDYVKLMSSPQESDNEILLTRFNPSAQTVVDPESESISFVEPNLHSESREEILQENMSKTVPVSQIDKDFQTEKLCLSKNSQNVEFKQGGSEGQVRGRDSSEDIKRRDNEDKSTPPRRKEDVSNKRGYQHQESTAERIQQLKAFWEKERNKPMFYTGKPKPLGDGKVARGANQAKLNKRFTKSEFDLTSLGNELGSDEEDTYRNHPNFTILPLNQRLERLSPSLGTSRRQFNTLRDFWDEATSDSKGSFPFDKPKSPKRKELLSVQLSSLELKSGDPDVYRLSSTVEKTRAAATKSSPPPQNRSKSPHDRQTGSGSRALGDSKNNLHNYTSAEAGQQRQSRRSSKESNREFSKLHSSSGKETRPPKGRKDSFGNSSSRGNSLRRVTSMFALSVVDDKDQRVDVSPFHSQSRKPRLNSEKGQRRSSEDAETLTPRARAFVPRDYRHYLGMTDTTVHASLTPTLKDEGSEGKSGFEADMSGPVRASTPVSSEERYSRKASKMSQRPLWANYSSSDAGQESSLSSTSETWSTSRNSSNRENDVDDQNPVRKALWRAETRPKNLAKSMEDITASLSPRQERRQDPSPDLRRISDASTIPSPSSSLYSDPDHLKKMSKSVPSFLQKEDTDGDSDTIYEDTYHRRRLMMGTSMTNLTSSSGLASVSSLSGSVMTMYSDFGNVEVQGNIQFSINYIQRLREFHIFVAECRDLAAVDPKRGRSDPYVKSYLVPDKANLGKRKTSVKKKTLNPTFNEILRYRVRMEYLRTQTLILSVWHHDTFGRNSFLGEVDVELSKWDFDHTQMNYLALKPRTTATVAPSNGRGEMRLAIRFLPQITHSEGIAKDGPNTGEIHIWVKECKNLPLIRATIDPYVKCFVLPDTSRKSRQKTRVLRRTVDPVFNHTMVYDGITEADLTEACVELTVWDRDRLASNLLGGLRLGGGTGRSYGAVVDWMDSSPYEVALWERMMASPTEWVEDVLPLRILNSAKNTSR
ncbi:synaptotagmin-like protein 2 isoform X1 [Amphiprion ocellaris]|uniref:Synaptotagmin-like protein 2 n=1 Tax=Amphiprion ocellaris TaxID=80972 RepID=A0AAQ5Y5L8_AMPOC|nr:synaptotagmin-like protein 2 isoform X1 [Amphiprion ocellaris]